MGPGGNTRNIPVRRVVYKFSDQTRHPLTRPCENRENQCPFCVATGLRACWLEDSGCKASRQRRPAATFNTGSHARSHGARSLVAASASEWMERTPTGNPVVIPLNATILIGENPSLEVARSPIVPHGGRCFLCES